jgi:hypothetical protein
MDEKKQNAASNNSAASENKIWLPPSYTNNKMPHSLAQKKKNIYLGIGNKTLWDWLNLLGVLAIPLIVAFASIYIAQLTTFKLAQPTPSISIHQSDTDIFGLRDKISWDNPVVKDQSIAISISLVPIPNGNISLQNATGSNYDFSLIAQLSASAFAIDPKVQEQQLLGQQTNSFTWTAIPLYSTKQALNIYVIGIWTPKNGGKTIERPMGNHIWHIDVADVATPFFGLGQITLSEFIVVLISSILNVPIMLDFLEKRRAAREKEKERGVLPQK